MRVRLSPTASFGSQWPLISLHAENDAEILVLRIFERKAEEQGGIQIASCGGNAGEGVWSLVISPKHVPAAGPENTSEQPPGTTL